ncbi:guanylate cyclase [Bradyrhizobium rifense]|uniref:Guanylate cyclase n=1 Tax=Bradyrhizobium rifense TaxID=515499 RepID=A0A5D3KH54_9BRAD|nr:guanylate cyclase [Bradyrhizobium rifense]
MERRLAAILAADVAGYSRLTSADEEGTHVQLQDHLRALVDPKIAEHRGRVVKNTGDGMLAEFSSVVDALRCALDVQHGMAERNAEVPDEKRIEFRISVNVGDVIIDRDDIFGDGVNVAARLEGLAKPGGICISEDAHRQVRGKFDVTFEDAGEQQLKNIARPVRVFRVALDDARPAKPISQPHNAALAVRRDRSSGRVTAIGAAVVLIAAAGGAAFYFHLGRAPVVSQMPDQLAKPSERFSIVVLPFANLSGDTSQDYLADVISDELTTGFSRFRDIFVISRSTAFTYKGKPTNVRQIGKDLGVRYALEGSVQPNGDRLRVNVQLIDTESDAHIWADQFDENRSDLLQMQDAIVTRIAHAIGMKMITERARLAQTRAANPNAEDLALRCSAALMRAHATSERDSAFRMCEQALQIDPENLRAASQESFKFTHRVANYTSPDRQADLRRADELASLAIKIDPNYSQAHTAKGDVLLLAGRYREALSWARRRKIPVVMVRSHTKLDSLGAEYGRLGSLAVVADDATGQLVDVVNEMKTAVRLFGGAALPAHFPPYVGSEQFRRLTRLRMAAMLRNNRMAARVLSVAFGSALDKWSGLYVTLTGDFDENAARNIVERMSNELRAEGLPLRHAGSFGFDFAATEWFRNSITGRYAVRIALSDFPDTITRRLITEIAGWWGRNQRQ